MIPNGRGRGRVRGPRPVSERIALAGDSAASTLTDGMLSVPAAALHATEHACVTSPAGTDPTCPLCGGSAA